MGSFLSRSGYQPISLLISLFIIFQNCESPLHFACKFGHVDMVQALLECPATDRHLLNIRSETADQVGYHADIKL